MINFLFVFRAQRSRARSRQCRRIAPDRRSDRTGVAAGSNSAARVCRSPAHRCPTFPIDRSATTRRRRRRCWRRSQIDRLRRHCSYRQPGPVYSSFSITNVSVKIGAIKKNPTAIRELSAG
jgi:hypothetical protein